MSSLRAITFISAATAAGLALISVASSLAVRCPAVKALKIPSSVAARIAWVRQARFFRAAKSAMVLFCDDSDMQELLRFGENVTR